MRAIVFLLASFWLLSAACAQSDPATASAQHVLKEQGFYYGEMTGRKDADTIAAIRRYQIRNGLQITGELNAETRKSLGVKGKIIEAPPRPAVPPIPDTSDLREDSAVRPMTSGLFEGTPYAGASPERQRRVIIDAQSLLARRGYYRSEIDGVFGPGTNFALQAFQAHFGLEANGRLDMETLTVLGLLPGQQAPGVTAGRRRIFPRPRGRVAPNGETIYEGR